MSREISIAAVSARVSWDVSFSVSLPSFKRHNVGANRKRRDQTGNNQPARPQSPALEEVGYSIIRSTAPAY